MNNNDYITNLFNQKCDEVMRYQDWLIGELNDVSKRLFTSEVISVLSDVIKQKHCAIQSDDNMLWITTMYDSLTVELNPNRVPCVAIRAGIAESKIIDRPKTIDQLRHAHKLLVSYKLLLDKINDQLPTIIKKAFDRKNAYDEELAHELEAMDFEIPTKSLPKYVVTIVREY